MTEAARLIKETDISLNELYIAVGYNNSNTFRRAFKKVYGVTPSSMQGKIEQSLDRNAQRNSRDIFGGFNPPEMPRLFSYLPAL